MPSQPFLYPLFSRRTNKWLDFFDESMVHVLGKLLFPAYEMDRAILTTFRGIMVSLTGCPYFVQVHIEEKEIDP
jgi:hypothetical protein